MGTLSAHDLCLEQNNNLNFEYKSCHSTAVKIIGSVRGSPIGTIGNFTNGTFGSQWYHWLTNGTIGRANGTICITIGTNGITNGTIGSTLNDIGKPLVPLIEP